MNMHLNTINQQILKYWEKNAMEDSISVNALLRQRRINMIEKDGGNVGHVNTLNCAKIVFRSRIT